MAVIQIAVAAHSRDGILFRSDLIFMVASNETFLYFTRWMDEVQKRSGCGGIYHLLLIYLFICYSLVSTHFPSIRWGSLARVP